MKKILFSPIGGTDPIKYDHDGSMLHICRHYKPDIVLLYLSKEMYNFHLKDNRYVSCIERLGQDLNHHFDIRLIIRSELTEVHEYDDIFEDFKKEIEKIKQEITEDDILIFNMASGTPAMKSALLLISTIEQYKYIPVQVPTPQRKINSKQDDRTEFDLELYWQFNEDNNPEAKNRCKENKCINILTMLKKDLIKQYVRNYNYAAALQIVKEIKTSLSEDVCELIRMANERLKLNFSEMDRILAKRNQYDIFPVKTTTEKNLFEYVLGLDIKLKREEYADFLRAITPLSTDLCENLLKKHCNIDLRQYTIVKNKKRLWKVDEIFGTDVFKILSKNYNDFNNKLSTTQFPTVYSTHLETLLLQLVNEDSLKRNVNSLREVEQKLRNVAAHEIISVTEDWFVKNVGKKPNEVFALINNLVKSLVIKITNNDWNSYDNMNNIIINLID